MLTTLASLCSWQVAKLDLLCWLASCLGTLFISIEIGLAVAVGLAVMLALYQSAFPHIAVLGRIGSGPMPVYRCGALTLLHDCHGVPLRHHTPCQ